MERNSENSANSENLMNHRRMNWGRFNDPASVLAFWSLTQELTGSNPITVMTNILVTEFSKFKENI